MNQLFHKDSRRLSLTVVTLLIISFCLATRLEPWFQAWPGNRIQSGNLLSIVFGDGRRIFANHFYVKADAYFHSGFYPTVFDNRQAFQTPHMAEDTGTVGGSNDGDEHGFLGKPRDWIDAFSRQLYPSAHTHLDAGGAQVTHAHPVELGDSSDVREILPWLSLSAELDPNRVETYTVTAYWLRQRMKKVEEAELFLRDGLRANPDSYEILFELGRVYDENKNDPDRARNLWEAALRRFQQKEAAGAKPDNFLFIQIISHLAKLEQKQGNHERAMALMRIWKQHSPNPEAVQKLIDEAEQQWPTPKTATFENHPEEGAHRPSGPKS
jgi:tetratricopeptide (TPR) repeat protein